MLEYSLPHCLQRKTSYFWPDGADIVIRTKSLRCLLGFNRSTESLAHLSAAEDDCLLGSIDGRMLLGSACFQIELC